MGLLATLPRATRGHLGDANDSLTRATRGYLQNAAAVIPEPVRRAGGGLRLIEPEWYRAQDSIFYLTLDGFTTAALEDGQTLVADSQIELELTGRTTARMIEPARTRPAPVTASPPKPQAVATRKAASSPPPAAPAGDAERHRLTQSVTTALEIDAKSDARVLDPTPSTQGISLRGSLWLSGESRIEVTQQGTDDELVVITALLAKELDRG